MINKVLEDFQNELDDIKNNKYAEALEKESDLEFSKRLDVDLFTARLVDEMPECFTNWLDPNLTGEVCLEPISKISIEVDSHGYLYASLYSKSNSCLVSEGSCISLYEWGLGDSDDVDEYAFERRQNLVAQFLALCFINALETLCESTEFLALPRCASISFTIGAHGSWSQDNAFVFYGTKNEIEWGNKRSKRLAHKSSCYTEPGSKSFEFIKSINEVDAQEHARELMPLLEQAMLWLGENAEDPIERFIIAWSSNFDRDIAFGGVTGKTEEDKKIYRWPNTFDLYKWFQNNRLKDLDAEGFSSERFALSHKIAQIACIACETLIETDAFKSLKKSDSFEMKVMNRTAGAQLVFYPFE